MPPKSCLSAEAEQLYREALRIYENTLAPEHSFFATILSNLALLYSRQGRDTEAEPLLKQALAIDVEFLGPQHPDVATDLNNLGVLYHAQGKHAKAEALYKRALAIMAAPGFSSPAR